MYVIKIKMNEKFKGSLIFKWDWSINFVFPHATINLHE